MKTQRVPVSVFALAVMMGALLIMAACSPKSQTTKEDVKPNPVYKGVWEGADEDGYHVARIIIDDESFPCQGYVLTQFGRGQIFRIKVSWFMEDGELVGMGAGDEEEKIAAAALVDGKLSGRVKSPIKVGDVDDLPFSGFRNAKQEVE